ncbi:MAG: rhodanese-like domain-containing protein [Arenicellales bacterium]
MNYTELLEQTYAQITEIMPWDFDDYLSENPNALLIDVREPAEFKMARLENAISAPRGILESACSWDFDETIPTLAAAQNHPVLLICRSGHRSAFAALRLQELGFKQVISLKLGMKGLNDEGKAIINAQGTELDGDDLDEWFNPPVREDQRQPI